MRTLLCTVLALFLAASLAQGQILSVTFQDEKAAKKYKKYTTEVGGRTVLLGEPVPGGGVSLEADKIVYQRSQDPRQSDENQFWVLDPRDPERIPYRMEDGEKVTTDKKALVTVMGAHIDRLAVFLRSEDIGSLAKEYQYRQARLRELEAERDAHDKGSAAWFDVHMRLLTDYERLVSWLDALSFAEAADDVRKDYEREAMAVSREARRERAEKALESVHRVDTYEDLVAASKEITGGSAKFHVQESQHVRIVYVEEIGDKRIELVLEQSERQIEGFRAEFVDPYLGEDFEDWLPDGLCVEFWFGPDDDAAHERFLTDFYGLSWGNDRARRLQTAGNSFHKTSLPAYLCYWRYSEEHNDIEGIVSHNLGHVLAGLHFNGSTRTMELPWLEEGLGYYLSFERFGRNTVTCREFRESNYVRKAPTEREKTVMLGLREIYNTIALEDGPRVDRLALKYLVEMEDADLAKSWSLFDYVAKEMGRDGQLWLRAAAQFARDRTKFMDEWRPFSEELFDVKGQDVFALLDERWREYAKSQQDTSERTR